VLNLQREQPYLNITKKDVLCVKIAGLCHDLGHGPFSHVFDGVFMRRVIAQDQERSLAGVSDLEGWAHEDGSCELFDHLISSNNIPYRKYGLSEVDLTFIKEMIMGERVRGRGPNKGFLYDIVSNSRSGLDVDKIDYFQRDMYHCGVSSNCNFDRFLELARVCRAEPIDPFFVKKKLRRIGDGGSSKVKVEQEEEEEFPLMICYPEKMYEETFNLFRTRFNLHRKVYTHRVVKQIELMVTDALVLANDHVKVFGSDGELVRMSDCVRDMEAYTNLDDSILQTIKREQKREELQSKNKLSQQSEDDDVIGPLQSAGNLISRITSGRNLYVCVGETTLTGSNATSFATIDIEDEISIKSDIVDCSIQILKEETVNHNILFAIQEERATTTNSSEEEDEDEEEVSDTTTPKRVGDIQSLSQSSFPTGFQKFMSSSNNNITSSIEEERGGGRSTPPPPTSSSSSSSLLGSDQIQDQLTIPPHSPKREFQHQREKSKIFTPSSSPLVVEDLIFDFMNIHHGLKSVNPVSRVRFFPKNGSYEASIARQISGDKFSTILPDHFQYKSLRVFCRHPSKEELAKRAFKRWCDGRGLASPIHSLSQQELSNNNNMQHQTNTNTPFILPSQY